LRLDEIFRTGQPKLFEEKDQQLGNVREQQCFPIYDDDGEVSMVVSLSRDISERKRKEEELKLFKIIAETANYGVIIADLSGYIVFVNEFFSIIHGYAHNELLGKNLSLLKLEGEKTSLQSLTEQLVKNGYCESTEIWHRCKDGSKIPLLVNGVTVYDEEKEPVYIAYNAIDISRQKAAEKQLFSYQSQLRSLASQLSETEEKERKQIAAALHDSLGQSLAVANIKRGDLLVHNVNSECAALITEIRTIIEDAIKSVRTLTFELCPPILYELPFDAALEWLVEQAEKQSNIHYTIESDNEPKPLNDSIKLLLFNAVRELLLNITKHAKAKNAKVSVKREDDKIKIVIEDDGVGFNVTQTTRRFDKKSFGLFNIEERLATIGG